jgi:hypothetical protein
MTTRLGEQSPGKPINQETKEQYMLLKKIGLAALVATFITGGAAVANAGHVGDGGPQGADTTAAALSAHMTPFSGPGWGARPTMGSHAYGYAKPVHSHRHIRR